MTNVVMAYIVQQMFDNGSFLETRQFSVIHKIVLGLLPFKDLEEELRGSTASINNVDVSGKSSLSWAAARADANAVRLLLKYGAKTENLDNSGWHGLHYAATAKNPICIQPLLDHSANVDSLNGAGLTPRHLASKSHDNDRFLRPLILAGADINAGGFEGETALMYAARNEHTHAAAFLLKDGADANAQTIWGLTALDLCVRYNRPRMLKLLLQWRGTDCTPRDIHGQTLLHQAARDGDARTVAALMDADLSDIDLDAKDSLEEDRMGLSGGAGN